MFVITAIKDLCKNICSWFFILSVKETYLNIFLKYYEAFKQLQ